MRARHDIDFVVGGQTEPVDVGIMQLSKLCSTGAAKQQSGRNPILQSPNCMTTPTG